MAPGVQALVVPGSGPVKRRREAEGLDKIFIEAGFEWRLPGCSMCLAMNNDRLNPGRTLCPQPATVTLKAVRAAADDTHLVSPAMAAAAAVTGHFADIRNLKVRRPSWQRIYPTYRPWWFRWILKRRYRRDHP